MIIASYAASDSSSLSGLKEIKNLGDEKQIK